MILDIFCEFYPKSLQKQGKYHTGTERSKLLNFVYKYVLGFSGVNLGLLGPVGAYWAIFYGSGQVPCSPVPVVGFIREFGVWESC